MNIVEQLNVDSLSKDLAVFWELSAAKIDSIRTDFDHAQGSPVFTIDGKYTTRGWTEWTQGFEYGSAILQFDATGAEEMLEHGRQKTVQQMASHVTHFGVHDHGFNNVSTYGNLLRLMNEGRIQESLWERRFYEMALVASASVQAKRWTALPDGGYIYSFNGPHSLFVDTIRSLRVLAIAHQLGHSMLEEKDRQVGLLDRLIAHAHATAKYSVYYGEGRDAYDLPGRTAHESVFNLNDGSYRCPNSQQGYSPFSTWTRGLAWAMLGFAEQLEFLDTCDDSDFQSTNQRADVEAVMCKAARATCEFYVANSAADGIPYWDTGAPRLHRMGDDHLEKPADPYNGFEPVDSSAAAIAAQGLLRFGSYLNNRGDKEAGDRLVKSGLTVVQTLLSSMYLSQNADHQGLLLHSVYHHPNGWDHIPAGKQVPCGESSMWGDYHLREVALLVGRMAENKYYTFFT